MSYHISDKGTVAVCKAVKGNCPFGGATGAENHFETKGEALKAFEASQADSTLPVKPVSTRMLKNSSYEVGFGARSYLRLLNHQDYDQAKSLYGKVKDAEVIETVKEIHRASIAILDLEEQLTKAQNRLSGAQTQQQRAGYIRNADDVARKLTQAVADFDGAEKKIDVLKAKYAKELGIHNNSLKALERLADSDKPTTRPEGIERRIAELKKVHKEIKTIKPVTDKLGRGNLEKTVDAAEAYGNPQYIESATQLRNATIEKEVLEEKRARLQHILRLASNENETIKNTITGELDKNEYAINRLVPTIRAAEPRVALFKDEIRDRGIQEEHITRELNALIKIEARTRPNTK